MKKTLLSIISAALLCGFAFHTEARSILTDSGTGFVFGLGPASSDTVGFDFTVGSKPLTITSLGMWDGPESVGGGSFTGSVGDGFASAHQVGLWDNSGNLLATTTMQIGTVDTLIGEFRYSSGFIPTNPGPVILAANTKYVLGAFFLASDPDSFKFSLGSAQPTYDPAVSPGKSRFVAGGFGFPSVSASPGAFVGPNATFTTVPDGGGSTGVLLVMALAVVFVLRRYGLQGANFTAGASELRRRE